MAEFVESLRYTADITDVRTKLDALARKVGDVDDVNAKVTTSISKRWTEAGDKLTRFGSTATRVATLPIAAGFALATKAASDLTEQISKTDNVFGAAAEEVHRFASGAAKDIGQSRRQAEEAVGTFGNLFNQLGIGTNQSAKLSIELTRLASDFASFHNADPTEVLLAMTAAFRGEYDAVQRFVPVINAAAVEHKALEMGLAATTKELDAQDKAIATNALLLDGAGKAVGDFDRTSGSLANQMRTTKAQLEDAAASLGEKLIPFAIKAATAVEGLVSWFAALPEPLQNVALGGLAVAAAIGPITTVAGGVAKALGGLSQAVTFLATSTNLAKVAASGFGLSIAGLAVGFVAYRTYLDALNRTNDKFNESAAKAVNNAALFEGATREAAAGLKEQAVEAYKAGVALNTHSDVQRGAAIVGEAMANEQEKARKVLAKLAETSGVSRERIVELANSLGINLGSMSEQARQKLAGAIAEVGRAVAPTERLAEVQGTLASKTATAAEQFDAFKTAMDAALGTVLSEREAAIALAEKVDALGRSIAENGTQTGLATEKQRNLTTSLIDVVRAAEAEVTAITKSGQISTDAATQKGALVERLEQLKARYPQLAGPIQEYIDKVNAIPQAPVTTPQVNIGPASAALAELRRQFDALRNVANAQGPSIFGPIGPPPKRHGGGDVEPGRMYITGGAGAEELFVPASAGHVYPDIRGALAALAFRSAPAAATPAPAAGTSVVIHQANHFAGVADTAGVRQALTEANGELVRALRAGRKAS